ncbi:palmitoyltransferase ZDHHC22 [Engraulis encrasicolus]|uniref:palmitoyltransferase ZDHHC22 n=1 Tax=Engraulis encrasicolus TaxID=184585 RepID=UPI002FD35B6E
MVMRMLQLRLLNVVAPAYFYAATAITIGLHLALFIPAIFHTPGVLIHTCLFLFMMLNALGNYVMTIWYPSETTDDETTVQQTLCTFDCMDAYYLHNNHHFCKLCKKVILRRDHHCFFTGNCIGNSNMRYFIMFCVYTSSICLYSLVLGVAYLTMEYSLSFENPLTFLTLLPLYTGYFFVGLIPGLQFLLVLMLYVWLGIGLVCAGFCCQQVLLVARGQTWCHLQKRGRLGKSRGEWRDNLRDVFGSQWALGLLLPVHTVKAADAALPDKGKGSAAINTGDDKNQKIDCVR